MVDKPKTQQAEPSAKDDLKKARTRLQGVATDSLRFNLQLAADAWGGTAEAVAQAFRAFRDEVDDASATRRGLFSGMVDGLFAGNASFFQHIADTSREVARAIKSSDLGKTTVAEESIDYERLADLVTDKLSKRKLEA